MRKQKSQRHDWPPPELSLPDLETLERLSRGEGEPTQGRLFDTRVITLEAIRRKMRGKA